MKLIMMTHDDHTQLFPPVNTSSDHSGTSLIDTNLGLLPWLDECPLTRSRNDRELNRLMTFFFFLTVVDDDEEEEEVEQVSCFY